MKLNIYKLCPYSPPKLYQSLYARCESDCMETVVSPFESLDLEGRNVRRIRSNRTSDINSATQSIHGLPSWLVQFSASQMRLEIMLKIAYVQCLPQAASSLPCNFRIIQPVVFKQVHRCCANTNEQHSTHFIPATLKLCAGVSITRYIHGINISLISRKTVSFGLQS